MSVKSRRGKTAAVSLFPFMAVLLCAMGALLLLLFALTEHARGLARKAVEEEPSSNQLLVEELEFRAQLVREANEQTEAQLAERRLDLSLIEDHIRRIRDEIKRLEDAAAALLARNLEPGAAISDDDIRQIEDKIADLRIKLEEIRENGLESSQSYAIVPYSGPNATRRRPIYVECVSDAVIFQPEGIRLEEDDFLEPLGPGNPLAAGLRAASEYLVSQGYRSDTVGEPYPLLLVRENGIIPYAAARAAMKSWGSDFGYEFVPNEWQLEYQPVDPVMADVIRRAVEEARVRRQLLVASAPSIYRNGRSAMRRSGGDGPGASAAGGAAGAPGGTGSSFAGHTATGAAGNSSESSNGDGDGDGTGAGAKPNGGSQGATSSEAPSGPSFPSGQPAGAQAQSGEAARPGEYFETSENKSSESRESDQTPLARTRGKGWGLPEAGRGSIPIARPIEIECRNEELAVYLGRAGASPVCRIAMPGETVGAVDELVSAIWEQVDSWGMAGRGMYWRPVLVLYVHPGGEHRYADLKQLLDGSGLELQEKLVAAPPAANQSTR